MYGFPNGSKGERAEYTRRKRERERRAINSYYGFSSGRGRKKNGCYVATAVYGSYDCPQVWTLRRYRDYKLAKTWTGRLFIRSYYLVSPTVVRVFGKTKWFNYLFKKKLDSMVTKLNNLGYSSEKYEDINW